MMGVLAGAPGPTSVAERAALRLDLLTGLLELPLGAAQKDVFRRVLSALNRDEFLMCSANWRNSIYARVNNLTDQTSRSSLSKVRHFG